MGILDKFLSKKPTKEEFGKDAISIVGSLMVKEPEMIPKRYRVKTFPNAEQLGRLSELSKEKSAGK